MLVRHMFSDGAWTSTSQFSYCGRVWKDMTWKTQLLGTRNQIRRESSLNSELKTLAWEMENMLRHSRCQNSGIEWKDIFSITKEPKAWPNISTESKEIEALQQRFDMYMISYISRGQNVITDFLVRTAKAFHGIMYFVSCSISVWISRSLQPWVMK